MPLAQNAHLIGGFLALLCLLGAFRSGRRRWLAENLPTSKTKEVLNGLVELKGTAEADGPPLYSHLTNQACLYYKWTVEEKWSCLSTEDGKLERDSAWERVAGGEMRIPFQLKDDLGSLLIRPEGAKIEPVVMFDKICKRNDPLYYGKGPERAVSHSKHERRFYEIGIPLHQELYIVGTARKSKDIFGSEIAADSRGSMFLISAWTEAEVRQRFKHRTVKWFFGGIAILVAGLLLRDMVASQVVTESWPVYALMIAAYLLAAGLTWIWMPLSKSSTIQS